MKEENMETIKAIKSNATATASASAATPETTSKAKVGPTWDANLTVADRALCKLAMDAAAGIDAAERCAAKAFQRCYAANLHGKAGFADFARWASLAGEAYGLPEKARGSIYRLVNAGIALQLGAQGNQDLSEVPAHTLAGILGFARKAAETPEGVAAIVRSRAGLYNARKAQGVRSETAHDEVIGKESKAAKTTPATAADRVKSLVSAALRVSDSWAERINAAEAALTELKKLRKAANN